MKLTNSCRHALFLLIIFLSNPNRRIAVYATASYFLNNPYFYIYKRMSDAPTDATLKKIW